MNLIILFWNKYKINITIKIIILVILKKIYKIMVILLRNDQIINKYIHK